MTLQDKLKAFRDNLAAIDGIKLYHYWRTDVKAPYCIWAEDGEDGSFNANNEKHEQAAAVYVDYFTQEEFDPAFEAIQDAMNKSRVRWRWSATSYEEQTNLIHHSWTAWVG